MINRIKIGMASCGVAAGADEVRDFIKENISDEIDITEVGCIGHCYAEPIVEVVTDEGSYLYENVKPEDEFLDKIINLKDYSRLNFKNKRKNREKKKITELAGEIDPCSIDEYQSKGGYQALTKALSMSPAEVIAEVKNSGLRGRGGAGFYTGVKWGFLAQQDTESKFLICNADEGDPGAFMDRTLMESVPHQVLEGLLIGAYATGATGIIIYVRAEYPRAVENLKQAIKQIENKGFNVFRDRNIGIVIKEGAGAFVCGEETAMINSLEGYRGNPRLKPPFPTDKGFQDDPTLINNVETLANIPVIINEGAEEFASLGTDDSKGTKLFALAGDLEYPGLVEVPMGITIGEIVYDIGGAVRGEVKAVQIGGPSGGCIPAEHFDTPVDYESLESLGAIMGSGGLIVIDESRCMVETARYFLDFTTEESCGKCTFCRVGTKRMLETLERITGGEGTETDVEFLDDISQKIINGSLCGLGQTAPNPVLSTLRYFKNEYNDHVTSKKCQALVCNDLIDIDLDNDKCQECGLCIEQCTVNAISDDFKIDNEKCTECNTCIEVCPVDAISRISRGVENNG